jgi:hypothetical protein
MKPTWIRSTSFLVAGLLAASLGATSAHAGLVYSNDFDAVAVVGSGVTATGLSNGAVGVATGSYAGSDGKVWANNFFFNGSTGNPATASTLTLTNLGAHTSVSIDLLLGFLNSWDSSDGSVSPDFLDVYIDGVLVKQLTAATASGTVTDYGGGTALVTGGQIDGNAFFSDNLADMSTAGFLTFAHTSSTLTLTLQASGNGWQGGADEFWGVDALKITTVDTGGTVPEPGTLALVLAAGVIGARLRRRA